VKRILSVVVSLVILAVIYWKIDFRRLLPVFHASDPLWMVLSLGMVVPLTLATAWRLRQLMPRGRTLPFGECNRLILVASVLNLVLPSKMGDIAKAYFMRERSGLSGSLALSLVVFEKACDMLSLLLWCVFGLVWVRCADPVAMRAFDAPEALAARGVSSDLFYWLSAAVVGGSLLLGMLLIGSRSFASAFFRLGARFAPKKLGAKLGKLASAWEEMHAYFWSDKRRLAVVSGTSVFIWLMHLLQIWMFILALRAFCPFIANLALSPLAILAGLLPVPTFGGAGTRDGALIWFYRPYFDSAVAACLGLLCTARYLLPALGGLPFVGGYLATARQLQREGPANAD
jgi:hypothetical protein